MTAKHPGTTPDIHIGHPGGNDHQVVTIPAPPGHPHDHQPGRWSQPVKPAPSQPTSRISQPVNPPDQPKQDDGSSLDDE